MFLNNGYNKKFYSDMQPNFLFRVLRKSFMEDFFQKYGSKIIGIKKVADKYLPNNATLIQSYSEKNLEKFQDELKLSKEYRFDTSDLNNIFLEFQTIIRNYSRAVFSIVKEDDITYYYIYDGYELKWVKAKDYLNLFNMENECLKLLEPYHNEFKKENK